MIEQILELLSKNHYYGKSELIEIAKGKFKMETTIRGKREQAKRLKDKGMNGYTKHDRPLTPVIIIGEYYIIESKLN